MVGFSSLFTLGLAGLAVAAPAAPLQKRAAANQTNIDGVILNYALTLEYLESAFYSAGLKKYSAADFTAAGFPDWVRYRLSEIASHEATHVSFLQTGLKAAGVTPTAACNYSFPDTSPASFLAVAQILEGVGVAAYAGAAQNITNPAYLTAAAQILTVEARHSAWIRGAAQHEDSFPAAFDVVLGFSQVYSLAAQFIKSCPASNPALPVKAFPVLTTSGTPAPGASIKATFPNSTAVNGYAVFVTATGQIAAPYNGSSGSVTIPAGLYGQNYLIITSSNATASDTNTLAGPAVVEVPLQATLFSRRK